MRTGKEMMAEERNVQAFNQDVEKNEGYLYTGDKLSCRLSNARMTEAILALGNVSAKRVIDIGCGDGTYTAEIARAGAASVLGVDAADAAVERARERCAPRTTAACRASDRRPAGAATAMAAAVARCCVSSTSCALCDRRHRA